MEQNKQIVTLFSVIWLVGYNERFGLGIFMLIKLLGPYVPTWIKVDPGPTSFGSSKLLIISVYMKYDMILKELK